MPLALTLQDLCTDLNPLPLSPQSKTLCLHKGHLLGLEWQTPPLHFLGTKSSTTS